MPVPALRALLAHRRRQQRLRDKENASASHGRRLPVPTSIMQSMNTFRISGLPASPFLHLFGQTDDELAAHGVTRSTADAKPGFPDRIELRDAEPGERVLLLNYVHQNADTPYRASHAIFVREGASQTYDRLDEVPELLRVRTLNLRAFDTAGLMLDADLVDGTQVENLIERLFANPAADYIHAHFAKRGCYAARIDRA